MDEIELLIIHFYKSSILRRIQSQDFYDFGAFYFLSVLSLPCLRIEANNYYRQQQTMSVNNENHNLKTEIKDFIQLLQMQKNQNSCNGRRRLSLDSDKLSVIYSASEPQSSLADKQNSHNSANKIEQLEQADFLVKEIKRLGVNSEQDKMLAKLLAIVMEGKKNLAAIQSKYKVLESQFEEEKAGTDEILKALVKMDEAEKQLYASYNQLSNRHDSLQRKYLGMKEENESLCEQLAQSGKDIQFMRKLVLVANQNYENIEKKCKDLERSSKVVVQRFKQQRSSPQIVTRSTIVHKKSSCSPSISDRSNMSARKGSFQENYRKLVLRTLKSKAVR